MAIGVIDRQGSGYFPTQREGIMPTFDRADFRALDTRDLDAAATKRFVAAAPTMDPVDRADLRDDIATLLAADGTDFVLTVAQLRRARQVLAALDAQRVAR